MYLCSCSLRQEQYAWTFSRRRKMTPRPQAQPMEGIIMDIALMMSLRVNTV